MSYASRPVLEVLPQFRGTATVHQTAAQRQRLIEFVAGESWHLLGVVRAIEMSQFQVIRKSQHPGAVPELDFDHGFAAPAPEGVQRVECLTVPDACFAIASRDRMENTQRFPSWHRSQHSNILAFLGN